MNYHVVFWSKDEKPMKINEQECATLGKFLNKAKFVTIQGNLIAVSDIKRINKIKEPAKQLPPPRSNPISKERLMELKKQLTKLFP